MPHEKKLILASASARRKKILTDMGLTFEVMIPDVEEKHLIDHPRRTAVDNAFKKAEWCRNLRPDSYIIAADTVIDFMGQCITKPATREEARIFLKKFSGKTQVVFTAVALVKPTSHGIRKHKQHGPEVHVGMSSVKFKELSDLIIEDYFERVDPADKAGAYDIDQHGDMLIESFDGSLTNIMGLPSELVSDWLITEGLL